MAKVGAEFMLLCVTVLYSFYGVIIGDAFLKRSQNISFYRDTALVWHPECLKRPLTNEQIRH